MSLRDQALKAGRVLLAREALGIVVRTAGMLAVSAIIGPEQYGLFAAPFFLVQFLAVLATAGTDVYLIRSRAELATDWLHVAFTYLLLASTLMAAGGIGLAQLGSGLLPDERMLLPLQVLLLSIPLNVLWVPARATLERTFSFRKLAVSELGSDVMQYAVAVGLALAGAGVWAAVYGFLARQAYMLVSSYLLARYRPRWLFDRRRIATMLHFGTPLSAGLMIRRGGEALVPQLVGTFAGPAALGVVSLGLRLAENANLITRATYRLALVTLGKVSDDLGRLRKAVEEVSSLQVLAVAPALVALSIGGSWVMPLLLGGEWSGLSRVLPFLAVGYLLQSLYTTSNAALMVLGVRTVPVTVGLASQVLHVAATAALVPPFGISGYGAAFVISVLGQLYGHRALRRIVPVSLAPVLPWALAAIPLLLVPLLPPVVWPLTVLPGVVLLAVPRTRSNLVRRVRAVRRAALGHAG